VLVAPFPGEQFVVPLCQFAVVTLWGGLCQPFREAIVGADPCLGACSTSVVPLFRTAV
jgi:hypothetical protein